MFFVPSPAPSGPPRLSISSWSCGCASPALHRCAPAALVLRLRLACAAPLRSCCVPAARSPLRVHCASTALPLRFHCASTALPPRVRCAPAAPPLRLRCAFCTRPTGNRLPWRCCSSSHLSAALRLLALFPMYTPLRFAPRTSLCCCPSPPRTSLCCCPSPPQGCQPPQRCQELLPVLVAGYSLSSSNRPGSPTFSDQSR